MSQENVEIVVLIGFGSLQDWANVAQIVGAIGIVIAAVALVIAWLQLKSSGDQLAKSAKWTRGAMIFAIDASLAQYDDVRTLVRQKDWEPPLKQKGETKEKTMSGFAFTGTWGCGSASSD